MVFPKKSFLDFRHLNKEAVEFLCAQARRIDIRRSRFMQDKIVALVFLEPSTRTRCSFEMAALRLGLRVINIDASESSLKKGETLSDTLVNIDAMGPDLIVVRHGTDEKLSDVESKVNALLVNGGEGVSGHPTQALLDLFTIMEERGYQSVTDIKDRILFVGDILHSRVARSNFDLLAMLNIPFAMAAPDEWARPLAEEYGCEFFTKVEDGLKWANVVMALRVQSERHLDDQKFNLQYFIHDFQINEARLKKFDPKGLVMHPGPVNWDVELTTGVSADRRCVLFKQVKNGVRIRAALLSQLLEID